MNNIRIRTTPNGQDKYLNIKLEQSFDFLEILSLKLSQEEVYRQYNSNYGVIAGRVIANGGFGVPNAKVSVFIPLDEIDSQDNIKSNLYPYLSPTTPNENGTRYNLLEDTKQSDCHTPVGTFPNKRKILDNNVWTEIYDKYYKFTTTTNASGDYMIFGVPIGLQEMHMDVDLSDIGFVSLRPYDLIAQGYNENLFFSNTKFKDGTNLDSLVQIQTQNTSVNVKPFWGDPTQNEIGINRLDFNIPIQITPTALFMGSIFTDNRRAFINRNCRPRAKMGRNCELKTGSGTVEILRRVTEDSNITERVGLGKLTEVDDNGTWVIPIPMNLNRVITDEFGNLIPSDDPNIGVPTTSKARFRISTSQYLTNPKLRTANYLVPNLYNRFQFDDNTVDEDMYDLEWRKIYTVSNYIPRVQRNNNDTNNNFTGIKLIGDCEQNSPFPFNRADFNFNPIYNIFCVIINVIAQLANIVNSLTSVTLTCGDLELEPDAWADCTKAALAEELGVITYEFYNDWVVGSLYAPLFKYKVRFKKNGKLYERFCDYECREIAGTPEEDEHYRNRCKDTFVVDRDEFNQNGVDYTVSDDATAEIAAPTGRGLILERDDFLYYVSRHDVEANTSNPPDLTVDGDSDGKNQLLFATNIQPLGSILQCDPDGTPFIIDRMEATSYNEREGFDDLFSFNGCNAVDPLTINEDLFLRNCQAGIDILSESEDDFPSTVIDANDTELREFLCESFGYYNETFVYSSSTTTITDNDGNDFDIISDFCEGCDDNENTLRTLHPYYLYFGLFQGKTAWDRIIQEYFQPCD